MRLSPENIEKKSREVLKQHQLEAIPINPVTLAHLAGFKVNNAKFSEDNISGMITKKGDNLTILVNADDHPNRKRFTIAHELAHHFLHLIGEGEFIDREADLFRSDSSKVGPSEQIVEIQANVFAACLLMPKDKIEEYWQKLKSISEMAILFGVSEEAMGYRLSKLGII